MTQDFREQLRVDPYADEELVPFDVRDYSGRRAMWMLGGLIALLLVAALIIFSLYQPGVRDRSEPPRITANDTPYKIAPEESGGEVTPDQDKIVYDVMNGERKPEVIENPVTSEEPVDMPDRANIVVEGQSTGSEPEVSALEPVVETPKPQPVQTQPVQTVASGDYVVQIASVRSQADAERIWAGVSSSFSDILPGYTGSDIKRVDLGDKGIYYRLRVVGMADKAAASELCERMKARDQACFVTRK